MQELKRTIRFCTSSDGARIAYATLGKGPPLVRAAHFLTHLEFEPRTLVWRPWLAEYSRDHALVRYDQRGCGLSEREAKNVSLEAMVADLEAVVDAADFHPDNRPELSVECSSLRVVDDPDRDRRSCLHYDCAAGGKHCVLS